MICVQRLCNVLSEQLKVFAKDKTALHSLLLNKRNMLKCVMTVGGFLTTTKDVWDIKICRREHVFPFQGGQKPILHGFAKIHATWICLPTFSFNQS